MSRNASGWDSWCRRIACQREREEKKEKRMHEQVEIGARSCRARIFSLWTTIIGVIGLLDFVETRNTSSRDRSNSLSHPQSSRVSRNSFLFSFYSSRLKTSKNIQHFSYFLFLSLRISHTIFPLESIDIKRE